MKICSKCKCQKGETSFSFDKRHSDGLHSACKECVNKWRRDNRERIKPGEKLWRLNNRDKVIKYDRRWKAKNPEKVRRSVVRWMKDNHEHRKEYMNRYVKSREKTDVDFLMANRLRTLVRVSLKNNSKSSKTMELLGCSIGRFKEYLSDKFMDGMSWDNYGKWHIDHIRPCSSFNLKNSEDQKRCFYYKNLQPLWAKDNLVKSNKYEDLDLKIADMNSVWNQDSKKDIYSAI